MADHVDITLWIDRRWKDAIEKHLKDETLQEHLEDVLDELCNQLPEQEYKRISAEIYAEDAARRAEEEAARTDAAYHVVENGQEWYFKTSPGEELLDAAEKLRGYVTAEKGSAPDLFIKLFADGYTVGFDEIKYSGCIACGLLLCIYSVNHAGDYSDHFGYGCRKVIYYVCDMLSCFTRLSRHVGYFGCDN